MIKKLFAATVIFFTFVNASVAYDFGEWKESTGISESEKGTDEFEASPQGVVTLAAEFLDGDLLKVSVLAEELEAAAVGVAFHLNYENEKLFFLRYEPGEFLEKGGDPFYLVRNNGDEGKIVFGETLRHDDAFPIGGGLIVDLYFQINNDGEFSFDFERGVISTIDTVRQDLNNIEWIGQTFSRSSQKKSVSKLTKADSVSGTTNGKLIFAALASAISVVGLLFLVVKKKFFFERGDKTARYY